MPFHGLCETPSIVPTWSSGDCALIDVAFAFDLEKEFYLNMNELDCSARYRQPSDSILYLV